MAWPFSKKSAAPATTAPAAAPASVGALEKLGGSAKSTLFSGISAAKGKSGWALVIAIIIGIGYFFYGLATGFVGIFATVPFYFQILIVGIILAILVGAGAKSGRAAAGTLFLFVILTFVVWFFMSTTLGQQKAAQLEVGAIGTLGPLQKVTAAYNQFQQYINNPNNLWQSTVIDSANVQAGVTLNNVAPLRDPFYAGQDLAIQGRLDALGFPGSNITATLTACHVLDPLTSQDCADEWPSCTPSTLKVSVARNRIFTCTHSSVPFDPDHLVYTVKLKVTAENTTTVSGKQFVFADVDALLALDPKADQLAALGVSSGNVKSFQEGDPSLNIGIDIAGEPAVLEADTADKAIDYYLGVNIENTASQTGVAEFPDSSDYRLTLYLPTVFLSPSSGTNGDFDCTNLTQNDTNTEFDSMKLSPPTAIQMSKCTARLPPSGLTAGNRLNAFLTIKTTKGILNGQTWGEFLVITKLKYAYSNEQLVPLTIQSAPSAIQPAV